MRIAGILLILLGVAMTITGGFRFQTKKKVLDTDKVDISTTENKTITRPWFAGGIAVVGGVALLLVSRRPNAK
ncbi:hypothetical protein [Flavisolibacter nicotianae]|uniref:hypothetical protein n=1 Tax=Flavisolibacter nicotianae TaxID=2364882 RepID=UPI000EB307CF|nr:hypothetical protein [Flavisolibacter nicotianae]